MLVAVLACFALAVLAPMVHARTGKASGWLLALLPAALFAYFLTFLPAIGAGETVVQSTGWVSLLDVALTFLLDGLSLLFALLITGIGTFIVIYGGGYLKGDKDIGRFYMFVLMFMGSMLGIVLTSNVISLFIFWELTSITSYLLIGYYHVAERARSAALQALVVTGVGGLALLAGLVLMAMAGGTFELSELLASPDLLREHPWYLAVLLLVLAGAFTKSAQFPFHFWLPGAMEAPTPVSAYLHSATMVKAGVYLLARLNPVMGETDAWLYLVGGFGLATMLIASYLALSHTDLKRMLAYTTVAALGTLTFLIGLGTPEAAKAMAVFLLVHALYKAALFMVAGALDHEAGSRHVTELSGLKTIMPVTFWAAVLSAASMAGLLPLFGFIGKELVYESAYHFVPGGWLLAVIAVLANVAVVAVAGVVALRPFLGPRKAPKGDKVHEAPASMWLGPVLLAVLSVAFGLLPSLVDGSVLAPAAGAVLGEALVFELALWHGFNVVLGLSVVTVALGALLYLSWDPVRAGLRGYDELLGEAPRRRYEGVLQGILDTAELSTRILQNGVLRNYLIVIIGFTVLLVGGTLLGRSELALWLDVADSRFYEWVVFGLIILGGLAATMLRSRLGPILALGLVGFNVALVFVLFGAPDLAITQFFVETLTVILVVLVLLQLPRHRFKSSRLVRWRDATVAALSGALVTALLLAVTRVPFDDAIPTYFAEASYPVAHGRNIVNVILVDFRALDTLGEIAVLAIAGIGVYALVKLVIRTKDAE